MNETNPKSPASESPARLGAAPAEPSGNGNKEAQVPCAIEEPSRRGPTGPKTPEGKATSSKNARKFGFFSREVPVESPFYKESKSEYKRELKALRKDLNPVGRAEEIQVELLVTHLFQYRRLIQIENALIRRRVIPDPESREATLIYERMYLQMEQGRSGPIAEVKDPWCEQDPIGSELRSTESLLRRFPDPEDLEWLQKCAERILNSYYKP